MMYRYAHVDNVRNGPRVVAALQIGATHSGYAYSLKSDFASDPLKISSHNWIANFRCLISRTVPTFLLFRSNKSLYKFGYEAEERYAELLECKEHHGWYFFQLDLSDDQLILQRGVTFKDVNGMVMDVEDVLSQAYRYLKDLFLEDLHYRCEGFDAEDVHWVLSSRNQSAVHVQFIRRAAEKAGFRPDKTRIVQEYESALLYCSYLGLQKSEEPMILPGKKCMVLDCGEGTVDLQFFERQENSTYKELESVNKVAEGGQMFKKEFIGVMEKIVGDQTMRKFKKGNPSDTLDFMREIERKMHRLTFETTGRTTFKLPMSLVELCKDECGESINEMIKKTVNADSIVQTWNKLRVVSDFLINMCKRTSELILHNVMKRTLNVKFRDLNKIIMIGKYADFKILQQTISKAFEEKGVEVIMFDEPDLVVLKGACIFGHTPQYVIERIHRSQQLTSDMEQSLHESAQALKDEWDSCMNKKHGSAKWKCINCADYMCEQCKITHMMGKKGRKHYMLHVGERDKEDAAHWEVFCKSHEENELDMYCITDKQAICIVCSMTAPHLYHETEKYDKYANRIRSDLGLAVKKADAIFPQYDKNIEELDQKISDAKSMITTNCQRIDFSLQRTIAKLKENAENYKAGEEKKMEAMVKSVASEMEELKKQMSETKNTILDARRFLENCSERELIHEAANHAEKLGLIKEPNSRAKNQLPVELEWDEIQRKLTNNLFATKP